MSVTVLEGTLKQPVEGPVPEPGVRYPSALPPDGRGRHGEQHDAAGVRVTGYLPVHTRAYTFSDSKIDVRITPLDKKDTLYGYKEPLPPDAGEPFRGEPTDFPE